MNSLGRALRATIGILAVVAIGCTAAASPSAEGPSAAAPSAAPSAAASVAASPSAVPSTEVSVAAPSAPASTGGSTGQARTYDCTALISDREIQQATGVGDLALFPAGNGAADPEGFTDCGYFGKSGSLYVQVSTWTGPSKVDFDRAWEQSAAAAEALPGIGDAATYARQGEQALGGAKAGDVGISVAFQEMNAGGFDGIDTKAAIAAILGTVAGRV